jgi:arylsulfatase A-like enzyme
MRPNIVNITCHDLGTQLGCYGDTTVPSPNIDGLADQGATFTNHFAAATPCSPSRGCIVTGRYSHSNRLIGLVNRGWDLPDQEVTVVDHLKESGYDTHHFGFQHERRDPSRNRYDSTWTDSGDSNMVVDRAIDFLESSKTPGRPFFANLGFIEVHLPFDRPHYVPDDPDEVFVPKYLPETEDTRTELARLHGSIRYMDEALGRLLTSLEETGLAPETLVVFTTDHGIALPRAKSTLYGPGVRTALIARLPGRIQAGRYDQLLSNIDLLPTVLDLVGRPMPSSIQGRSFLPLLTGDGCVPRAEVFCEKNYHDDYDPIRAVRTRRYSYLRSFEERCKVPLPMDIRASMASRCLRSDALDPRPPEEVYDLRDDPGEEKNLIQDPRYAAVTEDLRSRLLGWMRKTDDPLVTGRHLPVPAEQTL